MCIFILCYVPVAAILIIITVFISLPIDVLSTLFVFPIFSAVCSCWKIKRNQLPGICYVSASVVGISRTWMSVSVIFFINSTTEGFKKSITAEDSSVCECSCNYVLTESDYYKFLVITYLFILFSAKFVYSWAKESFHLQHHLYLIRYSISVKLANRINPMDISGNMLSSKNNNMDHFNSPVQTYYSVNDEEKASDNNSANGKMSIQLMFRGVLVGLVMLYIIMFLGITFVDIADQNEYGYSSSICIVLYVLGYGLLLILFGGYIIYMIYCFWLACKNK
eukprot:260489_1